MKPGFPITNDHLQLKPTTPFDGPVLEFDFPAMRVGVAEYLEGPTGCTTFLFPEGVSIATDVRGGAASFVGDYRRVHGICLSGGSIQGIEAIGGVISELFAQNGYNKDAPWLVTGAVVYDYLRPNAIYPDRELGRASVRAAQSGTFPLGARGAGACVKVGRGINWDQAEPGGQGGAFRQVGPTKLAVFTVVNAIGAIVDREGKVVRGHLDRRSGARHHLCDSLDLDFITEEPTPHENTTLTVLVTNQKLEPHFLRQLGRQVHSSMARAIQPFHTPFDGDILYAVTTNEIENPHMNGVALGALASEVAWDAVLSAVQ